MLEKDLVPSLLKTIQNDFWERYKKDTNIKRIEILIEEGKATYKEVNDFATLIGQLLVDTMGTNITADILPDGRMYYNIAERILNTTLVNDHNLIADMAEKVQGQLNKRAGIGIKAIRPSFNKDRVDGIVNRLAGESDFEKIKWILNEPIINFHEAISDEAIRVNAEFHALAGIPAVIYRISSGNCCKWCDELAGKYTYPDVPEDIYRRHDYCRCTVEYDPGEGKKQNVWTKGWV